MGGLGSGRRPAGSGRPIVASALGLDVNRLARRGILQAGNRCTGTLRWSDTRTLQNAGQCHYEANAEDPNFAWIRFRFREAGDRSPVESLIQLTTTVPPFGGFRWWFVCPRSGERVLKLYWSGQRGFASRKALGLVYPSSREGEFERAQRRLSKLKAKLNAVDFEIPTADLKPARMHWKTFERICQSIEAETLWADLLLAERVALRFGF